MDNNIENLQRCSTSNDSKILEQTLAEIDDMIKTYEKEKQINDDFDPIQEETVEDKFDAYLDDMQKYLIKGEYTKLFEMNHNVKLIKEDKVYRKNEINEILTCSITNVNRVIKDKILEETIHAKINDIIKPYEKESEIYDDFNSIEKEDILENKNDPKIDYKQNYSIKDDFLKSIESSPHFKLIQGERFNLKEKAECEIYITNRLKYHENDILNDKITAKLEQIRKIPDNDNKNDQNKSFISNSKNNFEDENLEETINDKINNLLKLTIKEEIEKENKGEIDNKEKEIFLEKDSLKKDENNSCGFNYIIRNIIKFYRRIFKK
jgi:hypothetical protein